MDFNKLFDESCLPVVLGKARSLIKEDCREIFQYIDENRPKTMLEFGVQYGCSSRVFIEIGKWFDYKIDLHSWDIVDKVKPECINKNDFHLHIKDVTGKEKLVFDTYNPDLVFLDAHPYQLTKALMQECLGRKIDFMCHDVDLSVFKRAEKQSNNFTNFMIYTDWELYVLGELISKDIYTNDNFDNDFVLVKCVRNNGGGGLAIIKNKR